LLTAKQALARARQWQTTVALGDAETPQLVVDLRGLSRSFRREDSDSELASLLETSPWVNIAIVDHELDPVFAPLVDAFDVILGYGTSSTTAIDLEPDEALVQSSLHELAAAITASPHASVSLVQLLRISHRLPVAQALHAESLTYAMLQTSETFRSWLTQRSADLVVDPTEQAVDIELVGSTLRIRLQRPLRRNALNVAMRDQLVEALELLDLDPSIDGAVISGAGRNFCAGGDLDEFGTTPTPAAGHRVRMLHSLPALMHRLRSRIRVHVHGSCVGAGIELPAFTSSVIAHPNATFRLPEIGFGLVPGAGGTVSVTRRCGRHRTAWLALTGAIITAENALEWQLVDRVDPTKFDAPGVIQ